MIVLISILGFWVMFLMAIIVEWGLAFFLDMMPLELSLMLNSVATSICITGIALALAGNYFQLSELLLNKNRSRDVFLMAIGGVLILLAFVVSPDWPRIIGHMVFGALTAFLVSATCGRVIMERTETFFSTLLFLFGCGVAVIALTWLVLF